MQICVEKIEIFRLRKGVTKSALAKMIGYQTPSGYSNLLKRKNVPTRAILDRIVALVGIGEKGLIQT